MSDEVWHLRAAAARGFLFRSAMAHIAWDKDMSPGEWMQWASESYPFTVGDLGDGELFHIATVAGEGLKRARRV